MATSPSNRLAAEASAYLRQHASNPVDWFPWGAEALEKAAREDKPIFLSIGYSACHWCHVMEKESFDDPSIALVLNTGFVAIKVDREERPDLDQIYQTVVQLMGRSGGWPLSVFLTPEQKPFFAGTYFPPERKYGMPSFREILDAVRTAYDTQRDDVVLQAKEITDAVSRALDAARNDGEVSPSPELLDRAADKLGARFDDEHGGFGGAPKFPSTMSLDVLLAHAVRKGDTVSESRVRRALWAMRAGGLWDHLAGGFHRYSTDEKWLVPHFEKMLYDNGLLLGLYLDAHRALGAHGDVVRDLAAWLVRDMQSPEGGFYASTDADSEGEEGKFFVFSPDDVAAAVSDPLARDVALAHYGITAQGNFERTGKTVLSEAVPLDRIALRLGQKPSRIEESLAVAKTEMLAYRAKRPAPFRDEKRLVSWNALVTAPLAEAGVVMGEPAWVSAAEAAMKDLGALVSDGRVGRYAMGAEKKLDGFLDDHASYGLACFRLWEVTGEPAWADRAKAAADEIVRRFWDDERAVFFFTPSDAPQLIARTEDPYDQATPSGSSQASLLFLSLGSLGHADLHAKAARYLEQMAGGAARNPFGFGRTLSALARLVSGSVDVVVVGAREDERTRALVRATLSAYLPARTLAQVDPTRPETARVAGPLAEDKPAKDVPVAYVCRGRTCSLPVSTPAELHALLTAP